MQYKEGAKLFFIRFRRVIIYSLVCLLAVAIVAIVAIKSNSDVRVVRDNVISTSAPSVIKFVMPVENGEIIKDFSNTSLKYNSTLKQWESHKAIDIKADDNSDVLAVYDGEVVSIKSTYLLGTVITIKHNDILQTVYGSLDENVSVSVGEAVKKGQKIGKVSQSAKNESNDGSHLHFEVLENGIKVDPSKYLESTNK